ncbi:MAG: hypothetical protein K2M10_10605 [Muribaculaceae bacterium]|nr:hypothetical protein [Muribaculaceae bacterium]
MKKIFWSIAIISSTFVSCSDDDSVERPVDELTSNDAVFVLTQGAFYDHVEGSFNVLNLKDGNWQQNVFTRVNGRSLGATPQCGIVYGSKIYIGTYESNTIEIIDRYTFESIKQIQLSGSTNGQEPRSMVSEKGKIYISMFDGYVARLDTLTMTIDASVKVGPNPEEICLHKGKIYVPNSDGMNYANDYADGTTVSVVTLNPFAVEKTLTVPLNPGVCVSSGDNVYLLSKGNYKVGKPDFIPSMVYKIENDGTTTPIQKGNMLTAGGDKIYIVDADYTMGGNHYYEYDTTSGRLEEKIVSGVEYPNCIAVDMVHSKIYISSNVWDGGFPGYTLPTYMMEYSLGWLPGKRYELGIGESAIFFGNK